MLKPASFIFALSLFLSCGHAPDAQNHTPALPEKDDVKQDLPINQAENFKVYDLTDTLRADFNADGVADVAVFGRNAASSNIVITDGLTHKQTRFGPQNPLEPMGEGLNWVDSWGIWVDSLTYEIEILNDEVVGQKDVVLIAPAIVLRQEEVGGGLIAWRGGKYTWVHQAD